MGDFKDWLTDEMGLKKESASDVESRLKRAGKFVDLCKEEQADYFIFEMGRNKEFQQLDRTVQSQLKRAIKLSTEYQKLNKKK